MAYVRQRRYADAEPLEKRALSIWEKVYGPRHARVARGLDNLAWLYGHQKRYAEAERSPYVKQLFLRVAPGDRVVFPSNNVEKCGNIISQAPARASRHRNAFSCSPGANVPLAKRCLGPVNSTVCVEDAPSAIAAMT